MERLVSIAGQLIVEIKTDEVSGQGLRHLITANTRIAPGGRSYRQALYAKQQGFSSILLGRIGDDYYGKIILDSLNRLGISTQFLEVSKSEYTGISFEVKRKGDAGRSVFFDPGASMGRGDFQYPIQNYLSLCDLVFLNQWLHPGLRAKILRFAEDNSIPTVYVCSAAPQEESFERGRRRGCVPHQAGQQPRTGRRDRSPGWPAGGVRCCRGLAPCSPGR